MALVYPLLLGCVWRDFLGGLVLFGWFKVLAVSALLGLMCGGGAWAKVSDGRVSKDRGVRALEERAEVRKDALKDGMAKINAAGAKVDESRTLVDEMRGRTKEIEERARQLELQSKAQTEDLGEARERYEARVRAAYKGDDLLGALSMVGGIVDEESITSSVQTAEVLSRGRDDIEQLEDTRQNLQNSIRQLEQKKEDYGVLVKEERRKSDELRSRERDLDAAIDRISESRTNIRQRIEARLRKLEAAEKAGKLRKPVSGGGDKIDQERELGISSHFDEMKTDSVAEPVRETSFKRYKELYKQAAEEYGFGEDWYVLMAVGQIESSHGENLGPSTSGALGPMQFLPSTWSTSGVDGNGDGKKNIMDPEDAIPAAAGYLRDGGAPNDWSAALYTYNHSGSYVKEVLAIAEGYRQRAGDKKAGPYI